MSYHSSLFGIDEAVHNSTRCMHLFMKCDKSWVICGHKRMHVHSLTKPTSSVEQLAVYKPERRERLGALPIKFRMASMSPNSNF